MPKRHNIFQDLMASIHTQLASSCRITESEMFADPSSGQAREVDLVIRSSVAGYEMIISVECTDRKRPVTVDWVEQMCCKHRDLPTHNLVLVSKSGYTKAALLKGSALGAELLSIEAAKQVDWAKYVNVYSRLFLIAIDGVTVVVPVSTTYTASSPYRGIPMKMEFVDSEGKFHATAEEIANALLSKEQIKAATVGKMDITDRGGWEILIPTKPGVRMRFQDGLEYEIDGLKVALLANPLVVCFDLKRFSFRDSQAAYGSSQTKYGDLLLTIVEVEGSKPSAQIRVRRPWGELQSYNLTGGAVEDFPIASDEAMEAIIDLSQDANERLWNCISSSSYNSFPSCTWER
jgi:hypothetical protein